MRVTNSMMISNMLMNLNKNLNVMSRKQDELATGKKVIFASDNPVAAAKILKYKTDIADMDQFSTNTRDAIAWLDASESAVAEMGSVLQRMRELAVQAANGTNTASDTQKIKEEIAQLKKHLITSANANFAGRYIFSSFYTDKALMDENGNYTIPITAEDIANKPVQLYEVSSRDYLPVGTHGVSIMGYVPEVNQFQALMPDAEAKGFAAEKAAYRMGIDLSNDFSVGTNITVTVNGTAYTVDKTKLKGSALQPLELQNVLNAFNDGTAGTAKLSDVADVYFDGNKNLCIRNKTVGSAGSITLSNFAGTSNWTDITKLNAPVTLGSMTTTVNGTNAVPAAIVAGPNLTNADVPDFLGKQFVVNFNGLTKTIQIPNDPLITTAAQLQTAVQAQLNSAFGSGKVNVTMTNGAPISFSTITGTGDTTQPQLRIQPVKAVKSQLIKDLDDFLGFLNVADQAGCSATLGKIDKHLNNLLSIRADIGARESRLDLIQSRIDENTITFTRLLSDSQDADMSEVIMNLKNAENVYKSALAVGGKIIQPSLVDFLR